MNMLDPYSYRVQVADRHGNPLFEDEADSQFGAEAVAVDVMNSHRRSLNAFDRYLIKVTTTFGYGVSRDPEKQPFKVFDLTMHSVLEVQSIREIEQ